MVLYNMEKRRGNFKHPHSHSREVAMQAVYQLDVVEHPLTKVLLFEWLNEPMGADETSFAQDLVQGVAEHWDALEKVVLAFSDKDTSQLSAVVRSILRLGIFELMRAELPAAIVIDDLLDLTRKYDGNDSVAFVNGVLNRFEQERSSRTA
jgi:N utilization substance protein B